MVVNATEKLKNLNMDRTSMDELIELRVAARHLAAERDQHGLKQPEWLIDAQSTLDGEIKARGKDELEKRKKDLLAQQSGLETNAEKRARIERELAEVDAKLGIGQASPAAVPA